MSRQTRRGFCRLTLTAFAAIGIVPIALPGPASDVIHINNYMARISLAFAEDMEMQQSISSAVFPILSKPDWQHEYFHTGVWGEDE